SSGRPKRRLALRISWSRPCRSRATMVRSRAGCPCPIVKASFHWAQLNSKARCKRALLVVNWTSRVAVMIDSWKRGLNSQHTPGAYLTAIRLFIVSDRGHHPGFARHESFAGGPGSLSLSFGGTGRLVSLRHGSPYDDTPATCSARDTRRL